MSEVEGKNLSDSGYINFAGILRCAQNDVFLFYKSYLSNRYLRLRLPAAKDRAHQDHAN